MSCCGQNQIINPTLQPTPPAAPQTLQFVKVNPGSTLTTGGQTFTEGQQTLVPASLAIQLAAQGTVTLSSGS
jgi:hypothetical protein